MMKVVLLIALAINVSIAEDPIDIGTILKTELRAGNVPHVPRASRTTDRSLACGSVDTLNHGEYVTLETPGYPYERYPNNFDCQWDLNFPAGSEVYLSCDYFWVKKGDYFSIGEDRYYGYSSGFDLWQMELEDTATNLKFGFTSNRRRNAWGFRCYVDVEAGDFTTAAPAPATTAAPAPAPAPATTAAPAGSCKCGQANTADRIVGGAATEQNEYPWQVALVSAGGSHPWCGGTLISPQHVLTAAHCTAGSSASSIAVLLGEHRIDDGSFNKVTLSAITDHPGYNSNTLDNDFSILTLSQPVTFSQSVSPACLPGGSQDYAGQVATVSGWGTLSSGGNQPTVLNDVQVTVKSNTECNSAYGGGITSNMICAADAGKDSCQGDSGGPLVVKENGRYALAGVVSWGYGCAMAQYPGVYARVTAQMDWILANTAGTENTTQC